MLQATERTKDDKVMRRSGETRFHMHADACTALYVAGCVHIRSIVSRRTLGSIGLGSQNLSEDSGCFSHRHEEPESRGCSNFARTEEIIPRSQLENRRRIAAGHHRILLAIVKEQ